MWIDHLIRLGDLTCGWMLRLPEGWVLPAMSLASALVIVAARRWAADQDLLWRIRADRRRLAERRREARRERDAAALERMRKTALDLGLKALRAEGLPLLAILLPLTVLGTWAFERLPNLPPRPGAQIVLRLRGPASAAGRLAHVVPAPELSAATGWIRRMEPSDAQTAAEWRVEAEAAAAFNLVARCHGRTFCHPFSAGLTTSPPAQLAHGEGWVTELDLEPRRLFGVVGGVACIGLAPWLAGYLLATMTATLLLKRLLRVA
ncbi:MAG: hypothetical protein H8E44_22805 [Planctomycetes bacterium]|nr:hypothetical protein [Planctomycetota bacterium]MBL7037051.1 hypothetical protein [Pirellulaceae bacterium]